MLLRGTGNMYVQYVRCSGRVHEQSEDDPREEEWTQLKHETSRQPPPDFLVFPRVALLFNRAGASAPYSLPMSISPAMLAPPGTPVGAPVQTALKNMQVRERLIQERKKAGRVRLIPQLVLYAVGVLCRFCLAFVSSCVPRAQVVRSCRLRLDRSLPLATSGTLPCTSCSTTGFPAVLRTIATLLPDPVAVARTVVRFVLLASLRWPMSLYLGCHLMESYCLTLFPCPPCFRYDFPCTCFFCCGCHCCCCCCLPLSGVTPTRYRRGRSCTSTSRWTP